MENGRQEIRTLECQLAIREQAEGAEGESRIIAGRAIVFNSKSEILDDWGMRFREIILPEAVTMEFLDTQDIKMNLLHDRDLTLARRNKGAANSTLRLAVDAEGLTFEFEAPKCDIGDRCLEMVRRGDYSGCSFTFIPQDYETEERDVNGKKDVTITHRKFRALTSLTIGMDPAYRQTSVNVREILERETDEEKRAREQAEAEAQKRAQEEADRKAAANRAYNYRKRKLSIN